LILTGQGSTNDVTIKNDADADVLEIPTGTTNVTIAGNLGVGGTVTAGGVVTANAGVVVDNITIDGTEIDLSSGDLTIDVEADIILDAKGGDILLKKDTAHWASIFTNGTDTFIQSMVNVGDLYLSGKDSGGSGINALVLDMGDSGKATFNNAVLVSGQILAHQTNVGVFEYNSNVTKIHSYGASSGTGQIQFLTGGGGGSADSLAMTIDNSQNVSIANGDLTITSTDAASTTAGPVLTLARDGASPEDDDLMGQILFKMDDDAGNLSTFAKIDVVATDVSNGSEDARIDFIAAKDDSFSPALSIAGQSVGIGTISPSAKLEIDQGSASSPLALKITGSSSPALNIVEATGVTAHVATDSAGVYVGSSTSHPLVLRTNNTERVRVDTSGRVGIGGTPNTNWRNDIADQEVLMLGTEATLFSDSGVTTALLNNVLINNADTFVNISERGASQYFQYQGAHKWYTAASASAGSSINTELTTPKMTLDVSGNLGIGTSSIDGTLHLDAGTSTDIIIEKDNAGYGALRFHNDGSQVSYILLDNAEDMTYYGGSGVKHIFYAGGAVTMTLDSGNVGIGAASLSTKLEVADNNAGAAIIRIRRTDVSDSDVDLKAGGGSDGKAFDISVNQANRFRIDSSGSIYSVQSGTNNLRFGEDAGVALGGSSQNNICIGKGALDALDEGINNIAIGVNALGADQHGRKSVAIGASALESQVYTADTDVNNVAIGNGAGSGVNGAVQCTLIGAGAGSGATMTGDNNVCVGYASGNLLQGGSENVFIGNEAGDGGATVSSSVAVGFRALSANAGNGNTCVGTEAGKVVTGQNNVIIGNQTAVQSTSCDDSVIIGKGACNSVDMTGHDNIVIGSGAANNLTGARNVIIGKDAVSTTTNLTSGTDNIFIGIEVKTNSSATTNAICMGDGVTAVGNENFTFGHTTTDSNIAFGATSITAPSDERYKENIQTATAGLSFINDLRPVTFQWKKEKDIPTDHEAYVEGSDTRVMLSNGETNHGFIAQEIKAVIDAHSEIKDGFKMWSAEQREDAEGNPVENTRQRLAPSELIPILTKAIQELSAKNDALEARIATLEGS